MDNHATTPVDPRVLEAMLPYFTRGVRQRRQPHHTLRLDGREGGRARARAGRRAHRRQRQGDRLHLGRDRVGQPRDQGRRRVLQGQGQPHHHRADRAQGGARHLQAPREGGLRGHLPAGRARTAASSPEEVRGGDDRQDDPRLDHARQQRDRHRAPDRRDRRGRQGAGRALPHRRGAGRRQDPVRRRRGEASTWRRSRRTRCTAPRASARSTCGASRACASPRRSTAAVTSAACARARSTCRASSASARRRSSCATEMADRGGAPARRCASGCARGSQSQVDATRSSTARWSTGCRATSTSRSPSSRARR